MPFKPTLIADLQMRRRRKLADDDPGPVPLPKMLSPRGQARQLDEERWRALEHRAESGGYGGTVSFAEDSIDGSSQPAGGAGDDQATQLSYDLVSLEDNYPSPGFPIGLSDRCWRILLPETLPIRRSGLSPVRVGLRLPELETPKEGFIPMDASPLTGCIEKERKGSQSPIMASICRPGAERVSLPPTMASSSRQFQIRRAPALGKMSS